LNWEIRLDRGGVRDVTGFSKTTVKNESQAQMDPFIAEASRENNMSYGLLQDISTFVEILFVQHHVSQGLVFLAGWKSRGVKIVPHS